MTCVENWLTPPAPLAPPKNQQQPRTPATYKRPEFPLWQFAVKTSLVFVSCHFCQDDHAFWFENRNSIVSESACCCRRPPHIRSVQRGPMKVALRCTPPVQPKFPVFACACCMFQQIPRDDSFSNTHATKYIRCEFRQSHEAFWCWWDTMYSVKVHVLVTSPLTCVLFWSPCLNS